LAGGQFDFVERSLGVLSPKLTQAILADGGKKLGNKVAEWIKENAEKALAGGMAVGTTIGKQILTDWLKQHFGIH
jgi:hypothetical protein